MNESAVDGLDRCYCFKHAFTSRIQLRTPLELRCFELRVDGADAVEVIDYDKCRKVQSLNIQGFNMAPQSCSSSN